MLFDASVGCLAVLSVRSCATPPGTSRRGTLYILIYHTRNKDYMSIQRFPSPDPIGRSGPLARPRPMGGRPGRAARVSLGENVEVPPHQGRIRSNPRFRYPLISLPLHICFVLSEMSGRTARISGFRISTGTPASCTQLTRGPYIFV